MVRFEAAAKGASWLIVAGSLMLVSTFGVLATTTDVVPNTDNLENGVVGSDRVVENSIINGGSWSFPEAIIKATGREPSTKWKEYLLKDPFAKQKNATEGKPAWSIYPPKASRPKLHWDDNIRGKRPRSCPHGGSMDVEYYGKEKCIISGQAICKDGWRFGVRQHFDDTFLMLWRENDPEFPIYKWFRGAKSLCIGEQYPNVAYMRVNYGEDELYYLIGPGSGRPDDLVRLKIVPDKKKYKPDDAVVKFRDGPGDRNALWQIFANGYSLTSNEALWYPIAARTPDPSSNPSWPPVSLPSSAPTDVPSSQPNGQPSNNPSLSTLPTDMDDGVQTALRVNINVPGDTNGTDVNQALMVVTSLNGDKIVFYGDADGDGNLVGLTQVSIVFLNGTAVQFQFDSEKRLTNLKGEGTAMGLAYNDPGNPSFSFFSDKGTPYTVQSNFSSENITVLNETTSNGDIERMLQGPSSPSRSTTVAITPLVCNQPSDHLSIDLQVELFAPPDTQDLQYFQMQNRGDGLYTTTIDLEIDSAPTITAAKKLCTAIADGIQTLCVVPFGLPTGSRLAIREFAKLICFPISLYFGPKAPVVLAGCVALYTAWAFTCDTLGAPDPTSPLSENKNIAQALCEQIDLPDVLEAQTIFIEASGTGFSAASGASFSTDLTVSETPIPEYVILPSPIVSGGLCCVNEDVDKRFCEQDCVAPYDTVAECYTSGFGLAAGDDCYINWVCIKSDPTPEPTAEPSFPTVEPTSEPTPEPTAQPTFEPTDSLEFCQETKILNTGRTVGKSLLFELTSMPMLPNFPQFEGRVKLNTFVRGDFGRIQGNGVHVRSISERASFFLYSKEFGIIRSLGRNYGGGECRSTFHEQSLPLMSGAIRDYNAAVQAGNGTVSILCKISSNVNFCSIFAEVYVQLEVDEGCAK